MGIFKKTSAVQIDKMNVVKDVIINEEKVKFSLNYSSTTLELDEVPKLLADVMQLYVYTKPLLDKRAAQEAKDKADELADEDTLDLTEIPF